MMDISHPITQVLSDEDQVIAHNIGNPKLGGGDAGTGEKSKKKRRRKACCSFKWKSLLCCVGSRCNVAKNCCRETDLAKAREESEPYSPNLEGSTTSRFLLPPLKPADADRKCLIIDLDETLVHSSFKPISNADFVVPVEIDGVIHQVYVLKRPHVDEFLQSVGKKYECVLFTASLAKYADPVADLLDKWNVFRARLFREACVFHRGNYVKDLGRLGRDLDRVVIIDNSPASYIFHPGNAVPVASWFDDMSDTELRDLIPYLEALSVSNDIYSYLRTHPHPLSCRRNTDRESAGGVGSDGASSSAAAATTAPAIVNSGPSGPNPPTNIIASVEKPGNVRRIPLSVVPTTGGGGGLESGTPSATTTTTTAAGDGDSCIQQLTKAAGRLMVHESASSVPSGNSMAGRNAVDASPRYESSFSSKTGDCAGCLASSSPPSPVAVTGGNDYSFNVMVSNGNGGSSGPGGDVLMYNSTAGTVKTP